jgi:hypothetical protein
MEFRYAVLRCGADWRVVGQHRKIGPFADRSSAVTSGARLALEAERAGHEVEFLVQDDSGELVKAQAALFATAPT